MSCKPLSQEALAQFNTDHPSADISQHHRRASVSTSRSSRDLSKEQLLSRPPAAALRRLSSDASQHSHATLLTRRDSFMLGKRFSVGPCVYGGRVSFSGLLLPQSVHETKHENTYRLGPDKGNTFSASRTKQILQATLTSYLEGACYDSETCGQFSQILADLLRSKVKDTCPPRYKLVCQVVVGQAANQSIEVTSRALIDSSSDDFAVATFQNGSMFIVAMVHGIYNE